MGRKIEIAFQGSILRLALHRVDRRRLYGTARRIGLDANGNECTSAMLTRDGRNVLGPGSTAGMYLDEQGDVIAREDLARVDEREWETTCDKTEPSGPHELAGPVPAKALLECVAGAVYEVDVAELDSKLAASLSRGDIYRASRAGFLLANEQDRKSVV